MPFTFKSKGEVGKSIPGITVVFSVMGTLSNIFELINPLIFAFELVANAFKAILGFALLLLLGPASVIMGIMKTIQDAFKVIKDFMDQLSPEKLKAFTVMYQYRGKISAIPESFRKYFQRGIPQSDKPNRRTRVFGLFFVAANESAAKGLLKLFGPPPIQDKPFASTAMKPIDKSYETTLGGKEYAGGFGITTSDAAAPPTKFKVFAWDDTSQSRHPLQAEGQLYIEKTPWEAGKEKKYNIAFMLGTIPGLPEGERELYSYVNAFHSLKYFLEVVEPANFDYSKIAAFNVYGYEGIEFPELPKDDSVNQISAVTVDYKVDQEADPQTWPDHLVINWKSTKSGQNPITGFEYEVALRRTDADPSDPDDFSEFITEFGRGHSFTVMGIGDKLIDKKSYVAIVRHKVKKENTFEILKEQSAPFTFSKSFTPIDIVTGMPVPENGKEYSDIEKEIIRYFVSKGFPEAIPTRAIMEDAQKEFKKKKDEAEAQNKLNEELVKAAKDPASEAEAKRKLAKSTSTYSFYEKVLARLNGWPAVAMIGNMLEVAGASVGLSPDGSLYLASSLVAGSESNFVSLSIRGDGQDVPADYVLLTSIASPVKGVDGVTKFENLSGVYRIRSVGSPGALVLDPQQLERRDDPETNAQKYLPVEGKIITGGKIDRVVGLSAANMPTTEVAPAPVFRLPAPMAEGDALSVVRERRDPVAFSVDLLPIGFRINDPRIKEGDELFYSVKKGNPIKVAAKLGQNLVTLPAGTVQADVELWRVLNVPHMVMNQEMVYLMPGVDLTPEDKVRVSFTKKNFADVLRAEVFRFEKLPSVSSAEIKFISRSPFNDAAPWIGFLSKLIGSVLPNLQNFENAILASVGRVLQQKRGVEAMIEYWEESVNNLKLIVKAFEAYLSIYTRFSNQIQGTLKAGTVYLYTYEGPINEMGREMEATLSRSNNTLEGGEVKPNEDVFALFWLAEGEVASRILKFMVGA